MKAYRVYEVGSPGEVGLSQYFLNLQDAEKRFKQIIKEKRKNKLTCTKEDLDGERNFKSNPHPDKSIIKNIRCFYWRKSSSCIAINEIRIKEIEVQE